MSYLRSGGWIRLSIWKHYPISKVLLCTISLTFALAFSYPVSIGAKSGQQIDLDQAIINTVTAPEGRRFVTGKILIHASPEVVWHTVHRQRQSDPDLAYSKVLERTDETRSVLEQKFVFLPVVGTAVCKMVHVEVPLKRIDYKLVESDHFRAMEGSWILTPHHSGKSTYLQLSSHLKLSFIVPQLILEKITARKLHKRLANVKAMAEGMQASIAERPAQTSAAAKSLPGL